MEFIPIDLQSWPRRQMFYYFSKMAPTGYSISVKPDIAYAHDFAKKAGIKFFPLYLWLVTKNLNKQVEFKVSEKDGTLGYYDTLTPLYAAFHEDDKTFSLMWTGWNDNFKEFYGTYLENERLFGGNHGVLAQSQTQPPANAYTVSCIPWVSFEHFAIHSYENKTYYFPSIESGKFIEQNGRLLMPLSITCHHATTDGYHINLFLQGLQNDFNSVQQFI